MLYEVITEEGNYSRWPPKVFSTGFIRAYAFFLSVDPDPVQSEYFAFLEKRSVDETPFHAKPEWLERERRRGSRRTAYAIVITSYSIHYTKLYESPTVTAGPSGAYQPRSTICTSNATTIKPGFSG